MLRRSFLVYLLILAPTISAWSADPSLVAHYRLDEGSGTVAYDSSGNGYDGMLLGQPQWVPGPEDSGVALAFNTTDGCTGIECPTFDPTDGTGQFSFATWAYWEGDAVYHHFFTKSDGWGAGTMMFQLELWGGHTSATYLDRIGISYAPNSTAFYLMPKNEWTHVAFVYDGANVVAYLNGVDDMGPKPVTIGSAVDARTVIGVADNDARVWNGALDDVQIYSRALAAGEIAKIMEGNVGLSSAPYPENGATDVPRDAILGWTAGEYAATHDVYLGTVFDDVNDANRANPMGVLVSQGQPATTYDPPGTLDFGATYYWRVDEVNAAPDFTIYKGEVWSFTVEPMAYPVENVTVTSNAISQEGSGPENTVNGSGLNADDQHSIKSSDMWLGSAPGADPIWLQYDLGRICKLHEMLVWNYNEQFEVVLGFGVKDVTIEYSTDGDQWTTLGDAELARATATADYTANTAVDLSGVAARYVRLTVNDNWGMLTQYGLSEVRFTSIPTFPQEPQPADGATGLDPATTLSWRAGREAATHEIHLGTDPADLPMVDAVGQASYAPDLQFGGTYYWQIVEVNEAETTTAWAGDVWSFSTLEYVLIDGFEEYDDDIDAGTTIFNTWVDGWVNENGSTVGYFDAPFAEQTIVRSGGQSMPLAYDNTASPFYSEAERVFDSAQDWTGYGADTLVLYFQGVPGAFSELASGKIIMGAAGADIWNAADEFRFAYKALNGNGSIVAYVESVANTNVWAKGGVMIRETLDAGATFAAVYATPGNGCRYQGRLTTDAAAVSDSSVVTAEQTAMTAPYWVKIERVGNTFNGYYSTDGENWTSMSWNPQTIAMNANVYIGLALTSHAAGVLASAEFSDIATTGNVTGQWAVETIGPEQPEGNGAGQLYVTLEDATGKTATAVHPSGDAAVLLGGWNAWPIPFSEFTGVNMGRVEVMRIGVGDPINPTAGGTGIIYVDDIGYGKPSNAE